MNNGKALTAEAAVALIQLELRRFTRDDSQIVKLVSQSCATEEQLDAWVSEGRPTHVILVAEDDNMFAFVDVSYGRLMLVDKLTQDTAVSITGAYCIHLNNYVQLDADYYGIEKRLFRAV